MGVILSEAVLQAERRISQNGAVAHLNSALHKASSRRARVFTSGPRDLPLAHGVVAGKTQTIELRSAKGGCPHLVLCQGDHVDFDQHVFRQTGNFDRGPRRRRAAEVLAVDLVHRGEVAHVS